MPKGLLGLAQRTGRRHLTKLGGVLHNVLGTRTFGEGGDQTALGKHTQLQLTFTHLHHGASHGRFCREAIEHAIVGQETVPADAALLSTEALPGIVSRQRTQLFLDPPVHRDALGGTMDLLIEPIAPGSCLLVEIINISKANARPEAIFDDPYTPLHFALRLGFSNLADTRRNP